MPVNSENICKSCHCHSQAANKSNSTKFNIQMQFRRSNLRAPAADVVDVVLFTRNPINCICAKKKLFSRIHHFDWARWRTNENLYKTNKINDKTLKPEWFYIFIMCSCFLVCVFCVAYLPTLIIIDMRTFCFFVVFRFVCFSVFFFSAVFGLAWKLLVWLAICVCTTRDSVHCAIVCAKTGP